MGNDGLYTIGAFAKLTSVTERTLRYYDRKGLLKPSFRNTHGHRFYTEKDLVVLQNIVTMKYLDYSLEEIAAHMREPGLDLLSSLALQKDMLQKKKQHLERVLDTIGRMQQITEGAGEIEKNLLLAFIHHIQYEENQKKVLSAQLPSEIVDALYMEHMLPGERLDIERKLTSFILELKEHCNSGKQPLDNDVLDTGKRLVAFLEAFLSPALQSLKDEQIAQLELLSDPSAASDPTLFLSVFTAEEEAYLKLVFDHLEVLKTMKEGVRNEKKE
ncbi:MerR family transcriptional regulator [Paenibacillus sp. 2TAB23]|uniref:MerR family transcriptional regulator n=1 Tax=Paenibacillus sp. 2TAB23 TaxID=3233004 RepID=UPI003F9B2158